MPNKERPALSERSESKGFTLIELLVVISIISILSVVGFVSYQNVTSKAKDARMRADIDAIKKAYETNYDPSANGGQGGYKPLSDSQFASGKIPTIDGQLPAADNSNSYIVTGPVGADSTGGNFAACVKSSDGSKCISPSQTNCSCVSSTQGTPFTSSSGSPNPSCDPYGRLATGLVGYWKMDEGS